jgi:hypothetical protein
MPGPLTQLASQLQRVVQSAKGSAAGGLVNPRSASLLFAPKQAADICDEDILAIGQEGLESLSVGALNGPAAAAAASLFSPSFRTFDRTLQVRC